MKPEQNKKQQIVSKNGSKKRSKTHNWRTLGRDKKWLVGRPAVHCPDPRISGTVARQHCCHLLIGEYSSASDRIAASAMAAVRCRATALLLLLLLAAIGTDAARQQPSIVDSEVSECENIPGPGCTHYCALCATLGVEQTVY
uniref:Uncharacterized protein n=1 Tax=Anopheles maculatus TaxID=74869 RepID=A0A182SP07_9DIPT